MTDRERILNGLRKGIQDDWNRPIRWQDDQIGLGVSRCPRDDDQPRTLQANYGAIRLDA